VNRDQKSAVIGEIADQIQEAQAVFAVDYRGISVTQAAELRVRLRDAGASFRVVKNSLTERAADQAGAEVLKEMLEGPTALTFVHGDAAVAAKAIADYARLTDLLPFKGGVLDGDRLEPDQIRAIARLPARDVLYGQLVGVVAHPVSGLVRTLSALIQGLALQLGQIAEQGLVAGAEPAPAEGAKAPAPADEAPAQAAETAGDPKAEPADTAGDADAEPREPAPVQASQAEGEDSPGETGEPAREAGAEALAGSEPREAEPESTTEAEPESNTEAEPEATPATDDTDADAPSPSGEGAEEKE